MLRFKPHHKGFSLLELILLVALLSIGIMTIMSAFSFAARLAGLSRDLISAVFLAQDIFQELEFKENQNLLIQKTVEEKDRKGKFEWQYTIRPATPLPLKKLNLTLSWLSVRRGERLNLNTYLR